MNRLSVLVFLILVPAASAQKARLLVPAYFPVPEGRQHWLDLARHQEKGAVEIVAVANVGIGAGHGVKGEVCNGGPFIPAGWDVKVTRTFYGEVVPNAAKKGVRVLGYVSTRRGERALDNVKKDIDEWKASFPGVSGIFFDEQAVGTPETPNHAKDKLAYYVALRKHVLMRFGDNGGSESDPRVVTNPGNVGSTPAHLELYLSDGRTRTVADIMVIREGTELDSYAPPEWTSKYKPSRFAMMMHHRPELKYIGTAVNQKRIGNVYVTDAPANAKESEWSRLPKYWADEVKVVRELNR